MTTATSVDARISVGAPNLALGRWSVYLRLNGPGTLDTTFSWGDGSNEIQVAYPRVQAGDVYAKRYLRPGLYAAQLGERALPFIVPPLKLTYGSIAGGARRSRASFPAAG